MRLRPNPYKVPDETILIKILRVILTIIILLAVGNWIISIMIDSA